jgi:hypothetical protein
MLQALLKGVVDSHAESAAIHEQSLKVMNQRATSEIEVMVAAMAAAVTATTALQSNIVCSKIPKKTWRCNANRSLGNLSPSHYIFRVQTG